jgi:dolichol kinase
MSSLKNVQRTTDSRNNAPVVPLLPPDRANRLTFRTLPYREVKRRFWHMSPGLLPFVLQIFPHRDPISPTLQGIILGCVALIAGRIFIGFRQIQRMGEGAGTAAVAGYALSFLLTILAFPADLELGLAVLAILAFGDGSATLIGLTLRGPVLPWNASKSWSGLIGFITVGSLMTAWIYWGETLNPEADEPPVSFALALCLTAPAVVTSAFFESLRSRVNDNIRVGVVAATTLILLHGLR